jgi:glycosyltransferase involved in cell wall biosynthesis
VYNQLAAYLEPHGYALAVASDGIQPNSPTPVQFDYFQIPVSAASVGRLLWRERFDVVIMFVNMRHRYLFPVYAVAKCLLRRKMVWWGQGRDLADPDNRFKNAAYAAEHALCDAIVLYAEHLKKYVAARFHRKVFIANNTLVVNYAGPPAGGREQALRRHGIRTTKNVICVGRFQRRKRIDQLVAAMQLMNRPDVGLVLVGPDMEGVLADVREENVYKLGEMYGDERFDLMSSADVYCLPGAVGLSIVDAFHCGLPFVTEEGDESAEIAYLKNGVNGLVVPRGDTTALANALRRLLDDDELRARLSRAAREEAGGNASMSRMCEGFVQALRYATRS